MESLKEFKYFDPATKEQIADPEVKLSFDKNGRPAWRNKKGQVTKNPNFWVGAETKGEQDNLSKLPASNALSPNQVLTPGQITNLEKAMKDKEASAAAEKASQDSKTIVKNLTDSGALQKEVTKAVINTESIPIFPDDISKISAAISKALKAATKSGLFDGEFLASEGEIVNAGQAMNATADAVVRTVLDSYLAPSRSSDGKNTFTYTFLPEEEEEPLQERRKKKEKKCLCVREATRSLKEEASTVTSQTNPPVENQTNPPAENQTNPPVEEPSVQNAKTVTVSEQCRKDLETVLKPKVTEILSDVLESIKSTATSVRFSCGYAGEPLQVGTEEPKEESTPQEGTGKTGEESVPQEGTEKLEGDGASQVEVSSEENKSSEKAEEALHSNDYYVFTRLVEAEDDGKTGTDENNESNKDPKTGEDPAKETDKEKENPKEEQSEAPTFPTTDALKTLIEGLNRSGKSFETDLAVYDLSYTLEDMDASSLSFNILVESTKTSPKEGFWEAFGKKLKAYLAKAGAQIASSLAGNRGHVN